MKAEKNEKLILTRLKSGDKEAYSEIYYLYVDAIFRFIYFRTGSKETAEDLTQEVFLKFIEIVDKEHITQIRPYLYRIARNLVIDHYKKTNNNVQIEKVEYKLIEEGKTEADAELVITQKALFRLKEEWRELIIMKHVDGLSHNEIAKVLGKSNVYIRVNLHRAIKALKNILEKNE